MTSQFQNRLVGAIVIIVISVIILAVLLNSNKKDNDTKFIVIPLISKPNNKYKIEPISPMTLKSIVIPSVSNTEEMISKVISHLQAKLTDSKFVQQQIQPKHTIAKVEKSAVLIPKQIIKFNQTMQVLQHNTYVIQLGILKNVTKVEEIIARLCLSGYQAYTEPLLSMNDQLTQIFIGPDNSKEKLQSYLPELKNLTGLQGQIRNY